jgi:hypothetical protein
MNRTYICRYLKDRIPRIQALSQYKTVLSSDAVMCLMALASAFLRGTFWCCHVSHAPPPPDGLCTAGIKKGLPVLDMQLGSRVFKAHSCVTEAHADVHVATMSLYSAASTQLTTPVHGYNGDMTRQDGTTALVMFNTVGWQTTRPSMPTPLKTSFTTPSHYDTRCCIRFQPPRGHMSGPGSRCNCPTLSCKRLGHAPLHRGRQIGRLRQGRLEHYNSVLPWT